MTRLGRIAAVTGVGILGIWGVLSASPAAAKTPRPAPASVASLSSFGYGSCALLTSGRVDCWGAGFFGQLGNGTFYRTGHTANARPVQVEGVGGTGTLSGVSSLTGDWTDSTCALLDSSGVDCWGFGDEGQLGNGTFNVSAIPVPVEGVGGTGTLTGVARLVTDRDGTYCALLDSGGVDCWGSGGYGALGNGTFSSSATPVQVDGVGGTGTLTGVAALASEGGSSYCALLDSGAVDCWGWGVDGELGNGTFYTATNNRGSATPVQVEGVGGTGTLNGVAALASDGSGFCAILGSGGVDCWGFGIGGELGNGTFYPRTGNDGSATPVQVEGVGGTGTLTGVRSLLSGDTAYCAILGSGGVDCWGDNFSGGLGNGTFSNSATPVQVEGVGGTGTLTGVRSLASVLQGVCAVLASGEVDCWGLGHDGELGNGRFPNGRDNYGSDTPVQVARGRLTGVASVTGEELDYCAVLDSGGVKCWGWGKDGELGNGHWAHSARPVKVALH